MSDAARDPAEGQLQATEDGRWRLRFERIMPHPVERVWSALTDEAELATWFPTTIEGELKAGAPLTFRFRDDEAPPTNGQMVACDPPRLMELSWGMSEEDIDQPERTRFELRREEEGSRLILISTFDSVGKSARDAAGWHVCLDLLDSGFAGTPPPKNSPELWRPVHRRYVERFGPEASTIGPPDSMPEYKE